MINEDTQCQPCVFMYIYVCVHSHVHVCVHWYNRHTDVICRGLGAEVPSMCVLCLYYNPPNHLIPCKTHSNQYPEAQKSYRTKQNIIMLNKIKQNSIGLLSLLWLSRCTILRGKSFGWMKMYLLSNQIKALWVQTEPWHISYFYKYKPSLIQMLEKEVVFQWRICVSA